MTEKGGKKSQNKINAKKAAVLGTDKKNRLPLMIAIVGALLLTGAAVLYIDQSGSNTTATTSSPSSSTGTVVTFPANLFDDGRARHFEHVDGKFTIRYFVLKSSDGVIRAAFDACDVCWPAGKGYYQEGDYMVCRNCARKFASVLVNEVKGGCNPAPLKRALENGKLVIQIKDIQEGRRYFTFSGKA